MKYLVGLIGLVAVFAAYTSIVLVRHTYVQAAYIQLQHDTMLCLVNIEYTEEPCVKAMESMGKFQKTSEAIGKAPKFYKLFVPKEAL